MARERFDFEDFTQTLNGNDLTFATDIHDFMLNNGCKATFEV